MEKIVIFGTGSGAKKVIKSINPKEYLVLAYIDNNINSHGKLFNGIKISGPQVLSDLDYDRIVICSTAYREIYLQLTQIYNIDQEKLVNKLYFLKKNMLEYYNQNQFEINDEISNVLNYLENNNLDVFNYQFTEKYDELIIDVHWDSNVNMFYVIHKEKRMYFKRDYNSVEKVIQYYRFISKEQDINSPHRYLTPGMNVEKGDIVIDAGVAEGNFALDIIEDVSKIYLIETDDGWIEALKETFKKYTDKVVFVNKFLTDCNDENNISLDALIGSDNINYIKMDIEGEEVKALHGADNVLRENKKLKLEICAYHNIEDEHLIKEFLSKFDFKISVSDGYMFFVNDDVYERKEPRLVRGLVHAIKEY